MKQKEDNPIKTLFEFSGDAKGKMPLSVILTVLSELFGMLPYLTAASCWKRRPAYIKISL